jgi:glutamate--cysteine ligase
MSTYEPGEMTPVAGVKHLRETLSPRGVEPGRMGLEWELLPCHPGGRLASYFGPGGVHEAFGTLAKRGYRPHFEGGCVVGLTAPSGSFIGLEPGAQIEVASPPLSALSGLAAELGGQQASVALAAGDLGWTPQPWGLAPRNDAEDLPDVPKERYLLLANHLRRKGRLGRWMMKLSASTQFNLDTPGVEALRVQADGALRLLPYLTGWLANSPVARGRKGPWKTRRPWIWRHTDRGRCGLPLFLFRPSADPVAEWVRYYLGREALFFVREGAWIPGEGRSFRQWMASPGPLAPITLDDWFLHISGAFPDIRYRGYLELRTADSVPLPDLMGAAALCKGLLGDPGRVRSWAGLLPDPHPSRTRENLLRAARGGGKWVPLAGPGPRELAPSLFSEARMGLLALGDDPGWLEPLERSARDGRCPADSWRAIPGGGWSGPEEQAP